MARPGYSLWLPLPPVSKGRKSSSSTPAAGTEKEKIQITKSVSSKMECNFDHAWNERGLFYALDLGGTNFRVLRTQLGGKDERVIDTEFEQVSTPQDLMSGTSEPGRDIVACLNEAMGRPGLDMRVSALVHKLLSRSTHVSSQSITRDA